MRARTLASPCDKPVTVYVPVDAPESMKMLGGRPLMGAAEPVKVSVSPPVGAGPFRVTVPVPVIPIPSELGDITCEAIP